jgi:AraC-like DNA-binding protein
MSKKEKIPGFRESEPLDDKSSWMLTKLSPYLRQSGNQWRPNWNIGKRKLLDYLLVFIDSGEGIFHLDGKTFPVASGDAILIPPDTLHEMSGTSEKMHCIYLHFDLIYDAERSNWDACIPSGIQDLSPFKKFMHPKISDSFWENLKGRLHLINPNTIKALMIRICSLHTDCKAAKALRISGILFELLSEIQDQILEHEKKPVLNHDKLITAAKYISEHPELAISIKDLAKKSGLSESHFRKLFHQVHGVSPKIMYSQVRIRKACELLTYWNMNVTETAEHLNFSSVYSFSRTFKNILGISPTQYLKNIC